MNPKKNYRNLVNIKVTKQRRAQLRWFFILLSLLIVKESSSGFTSKTTKRSTLRPTTKPTKKTTAKPFTNKFTLQHTSKPTIRAGFTSKITKRSTLKPTTKSTKKATPKPFPNKFTLQHTSKATIKAGYCTTAAGAWARSGSCPHLEKYITNVTSSFVMSIIASCNQAAFAQSVVAVAGASSWAAHFCNTPVAMRALNCSYLSFIANVSTWVPTYMSLCNSPTGPTKTVFFKYSGGIQTFTVPRNVSAVTISAAGAQGGSWNSGTGGNGAVLTGTFSVRMGEVLSILVGGTPVSTRFAAGGGGTFVAHGASLSSAIPLVVAGGGGGASGSLNVGQGGQITMSGGGPFPGMNGYGAPSTLCGGGGGGFFSRGGNDTMYPLQGGGGAGFRQGGAGGRSLQYTDGGFGGGATPDFASNCNSEGGAGGGYSGGSGQNTFNTVYVGFGGGSYNSGTAKQNKPASWSGNGLASISYTPGSSWESCSAVYSSWMKSGVCPKLSAFVDLVVSAGDVSTLCSQQKFNESVIAAAGGWSKWAPCATASVVSPFLNCMYTYWTSEQITSNQTYLDFFSMFCAGGGSITVTGLSSYTVAVGGSIDVYWSSSLVDYVDIILYSSSGTWASGVYGVSASTMSNMFSIPAELVAGTYYFLIYSSTKNSISGQSAYFSVTHNIGSGSITVTGLSSYTVAVGGSIDVFWSSSLIDYIDIILYSSSGTWASGVYWVSASSMSNVFSIPAQVVAGTFYFQLYSSTNNSISGQSAYFSVTQNVVCPKGCQTCSGPTSCTSCNAGLILQKGNCVCAKGMHASSQGCTDCAENCASCTSAKECVSCAPGYYLHKNKCKVCHKGCKMCDSSFNCFTCESGLYLSQGNCASFCPDGTYGQSGVCTACLDECATCKDNYSCTSCNARFFHSNEKCYACSFGCSVCHSLKSCLSCQPGFLLMHKQCIDSSVSGDEVVVLRKIRGGY